MAGDGWIACSRKSMPDADQVVMTYAPKSNEPVWPGVWNGDEWEDEFGFPVGREVTHWMPFPEPPGMRGCVCVQDECFPEGA